MNQDNSQENSKQNKVRQSRRGQPSDGQTEVEVLSGFVLPERYQRLKDVAKTRTRHLTLVLDRVNHAHNISAVLRSADAFGIQEIHVVGGSLALNPSIALGSERWVDIRTHPDAEAAITTLQSERYELVITQPKSSPTRTPTLADSDSIAVDCLPFQRKLAIVFGNEVGGLSPPFCEAASIRTHIPMFGFVESFNISVAAAIILFCFAANREQGNRQIPGLSPTEQTKLIARWLEQDVPGAELILERYYETR